MTFNFDWITNWKSVVNVLITAAIYAAIGTTSVWLAAPDDTPFLSKVVLAGGVLPVLAALKERMTKPANG